jgi:hypothetical protein
MSLDERVSDVAELHGPDSVPAWALRSSMDRFEACSERVPERPRAAASTDDDGRQSGVRTLS